MAYNIRTDFLSDQDADRMYEQHPEMGSDPLEYCPTCSTTGTYRWRGEDRKCECSYALQLQKHYFNSGVGLDYQILDWDDFVPNNPTKVAALETVQTWLGNEQLIRRGMGLVFMGPGGVGKTLLSNLIIKELIKRGHKCYASSVSAMKEALTAGWNSDEEKRWFDRRFRYSQVLLLDDLGKEHKNTLSQSTFDGVLRTRVQGGRPTILTTNLSLDAMSSGYGSSVLSLLRRQSLVLEMEGEDFAGQHAQRLLAESLSGETRPIV